MRKNSLVSSVLICFGLLSSATLSYTQDSVNFREFLEERLAKSQRKVTENGRQRVITGIKLSEVCDVDNDKVAERVFADYGAIFIAGNGVLFPTKCVFKDETQVQFYQSNARPKSAAVGGVAIELQEPAMNALLEAVKEAAKKNLKITPRGGSEAARRSYEKTVELWNSRFYPALTYWVGKGKISRRDADAAKAMPINAQVAQVLAWESKRLWFSKDLSKSILYSVAAPGASQHIFMLALDVEQYSNKQVREILARHGWFQTVKSDLPHFTYLGITDKNELPKLGLRKELIGGQEFWIPNLD
ncbi:MAG: hypothetical protein ABWZ66_12745 [Pyrinomonadaceae bacterium]